MYIYVCIRAIMALADIPHDNSWAITWNQGGGIRGNDRMGRVIDNTCATDTSRTDDTPVTTDIRVAEPTTTKIPDIEQDAVDAFNKTQEVMFTVNGSRIPIFHVITPGVHTDNPSTDYGMCNMILYTLDTFLRDILGHIPIAARSYSTSNRTYNGHTRKLLESLPLNPSSATVVDGDTCDEVKVFIDELLFRSNGIDWPVHEWVENNNRLLSLVTNDRLMAPISSALSDVNTIWAARNSPVPPLVAFLVTDNALSDFAVLCRAHAGLLSQLSRSNALTTAASNRASTSRVLAIQSIAQFKYTRTGGGCRIPWRLIRDTGIVN